MALEDQLNGNLGAADENQLFDNAFSWEPKRQHQFILSMADTGIPAYLVKTSGKPNINNGEVALDLINVKRYVKGKSEWDAISMTLYDAIVPSGAQTVMEWVRLHHESATGRDGYSNFYKKNLKLHQLSPLGEKVEEWTLNGAFIVSAGFGTYDWAAGDSVQEIELSIRFDWAFLNF
tara:strand:+ start:3446 stop:3976 length:531 start_codon:yes stop_codon:yes gene_type:complete